MKQEEFAQQIRMIFDQHIALIKSNTTLLQINLDLMKENKKLIEKAESSKGEK